MFKRFLALAVVAVMVLSIAVSCRRDEPAPQDQGATPPPAGGTQTTTPVPSPPQTPITPPDAITIQGEESEALIWQTIRNLQERFPAGTAVGEGVGGTLNFALVQADAFAGVHNPVYSTLAPDGRINDFMFAGLLNVYENNFFNDSGAAWFEYDRGEQVRDADNNVVEVVRPASFTIHFHDHTNMYWWDGVPVTMYDLQFALEMIAYPGQDSQRFGPANNTSNILGVPEYRDDPSVGISGIRVFNDGRSITYYYEAIPPTILIGGVWAQPMPKHHFDGIPMGEIYSHANSRSNPLGNGAFMFSHSVPGESVALVANPNFHLGAPNLDGINIATINPNLIGEAMLAGQFDIAQFPMIHALDYEPRMTNVTLVSALERRFDFMGFRFGTRDAVEGVMTNNYDLYTHCLALRQALGYARDDGTTTATLFNGFRFPISTSMVPWQGSFMYEGIDGFLVFDLDKANAILDEAGYEWLPGEDFRRHNVTGEPFTLRWLIANNFVENEDKAPHHIQNWAAVGLDVRLFEDRFVTLPERTQVLTYDTDNGTVHIYDATWLVGSNPDPNGLWGNASHNGTRYSSPEFDAILAGFETDAAWDIAQLHETMWEFQRYVYRNATWVPVSTAIELWAANNRVLNYSLDRSNPDSTQPGNNRWWHWDLTSPNPETER